MNDQSIRQLRGKLKDTESQMAKLKAKVDKKTWTDKDAKAYAALKKQADQMSRVINDWDDGRD